MDGRERRLERDVATTAGRAHGENGNRSVLIVHPGATPYGFQRHTCEGRLYAGVAFDISCSNRAIAVFGREVAIDAFGRDAAEARFRVSVSPDIRQCDSSISRDGTDSLRDVRCLDGSKRGLERDGSPDVPHRDFPVGSLGIERTVEILQLYVAKGIVDGRGSSRQRARLDAAVVGRAIYTAFHVGERHVSKTVAYVKRAADCRNIQVAVVVVDGQIAVDVSRVHVPK